MSFKTSLDMLTSPAQNKLTKDTKHLLNTVKQ